jgi:hypothetical protein
MLRKLGACVAVAVLAGVSAAQQPEAPLSGPPVKQTRPPGLEGQFAEGRGGDRRRPMVERVPFRLYAQAIEKLRGDGAPEGLRLAPEQNEKITALENEFRTASREFAQKMRQEGGQRPRRGDGGGDEMTPAERSKMEEIRRSAPKAEDYQIKIYAALSPEQKKFVEDEVAKAREELDRKRGEDYMQRERDRRKNAAQPQPPKPDPQRADGPPPPPGAPLVPPEARERFRRIVERIQQLPPDQREQFLRRIEEELERRIGPRPDAPNPPKAVPDGKDANAPPPDKKV